MDLDTIESVVVGNAISNLFFPVVALAVTGVAIIAQGFRAAARLTAHEIGDAASNMRDNRLQREWGQRATAILSSPDGEEKFKREGNLERGKIVATWMKNPDLLMNYTAQILACVDIYVRATSVMTGAEAADLLNAFRYKHLQVEDPRSRKIIDRIFELVGRQPTNIQSVEAVSSLPFQFAALTTPANKDACRGLLIRALDEPHNSVGQRQLLEILLFPASSNGNIRRTAELSLDRGGYSEEQRKHICFRCSTIINELESQQGRDGYSSYRRNPDLEDFTTRARNALGVEPAKSLSGTVVRFPAAARRM